MRTQPRFSVLTFVLVALTALGVLSKILLPYVVMPASKRLINARPLFLQAGAHEHIAWYPVSDKPFQEARRLDRPIFLVVGAPWGPTGRQMDAAVFTSIPLQKLLDRNFISVRADEVETPGWMSAYLPLARVGLGLGSTFQMWFLDSQGRLMMPIGVRVVDAPISDTQLMSELVADLATLDRVRSGELVDTGGPQGAGSAQSADLDRILQPPETLVPSLSSYRDVLATETGSSAAGGFPVAQHQRLWPDAWEFLLATSSPAVVEQSLDALLKSPCRDLVDGGFFLGARDTSWRTPAYDKVAILNAEMCELLARLSAKADPSAPYAQFARDTFDALASANGDFINSDGVIGACRVGDERPPFGRSTRSSFTPREVRSLLDGVERDWAQQYLHLRPDENPVMTPYVTDFGLIGTPMYRRVVSKLVHRGLPPNVDAEAALGFCGTSVARLLDAARLLGDRNRMLRAQNIASHLDLFRRGQDVAHEVSPSERSRSTLADYLGYADAALADFLAFSQVETLQGGALVLNRGLSLFQIPNSGCYRASLPTSPHRLALDSNSPQICDDLGESGNAQAIRLAWSYSVLLSRSDVPADRALAKQLRARAGACIAQFADVASGLHAYGGGYGYASALAMDDTFVLCSGPDPSAMANAFAPLAPCRLVIPVAGPVYPALVRKPGYYVSRHGKLLGPMSKAQAAGLVSQPLFISG